jgi:hypothetical protein
MRRRLTWIVLSAVLGAAAYGVTALATPGSGFTGTTIAKGRFGDIDVNNFTIPASNWQARLNTRGDSDLYVQSNVWNPLGHTGWHTHPGHSLIVVTEGTLWVYDGDDPSCTPTEYKVGDGLLDPGGDHVHLIKNPSATSQARTTTVQLIPADAVRRIDAPAPAGCTVQ